MLEWKATRSDLGTIYNGWSARQEIAARVYRSEDGRAWVAEVRLPAGRPNRIMAGFRTAKDAKAEASAEYESARVAHYRSEESAGFPALRAAAVRTARADDFEMHAPGLSSATRLAVFKRCASDDHQRLAFRVAGGIGFGEMWNAWRDAYRAERCALTQARMIRNASEESA